MNINNIREKMLRLARLLMCLPFLTWWGMAEGQVTDSLSGYLKEAAMHNPGLKARYLEYLAAMEKIPQAGTLPDPEMQFGFFIAPMELLGGNQLADFRLMQMAPWFGTLKAAKDEASKMALARYQAMLKAKNELFLQVKMSWYELYRTRKEIEVTEKNLVLLKSLERMALIRFESAGISGSAGPGAMAQPAEAARNSGSSGMTGSNMGSPAAGSPGNTGSMQNTGDAPMGSSGQGGLVNLLRVQIEIGSLGNRLALLNDQLNTAKARFNSNLYRKKDTEVFITDSLVQTALPVSVVLMADSIRNNPMVKMYEADEAANEAKIKMAGLMGYPMVGIGLNYSLIKKRPESGSMMNGRDMVMPMFTATLPIYRKKYTALRREAEFLRDASAESAQNVENDLGVYFQEVLQLYNDADRRAQLFERQTVLSGEMLTLLTRSFSAAGTDFEEILRMQQQLLDYQFRQIEAVVDRNIAIAKLTSIISNN